MRAFRRESPLTLNYDPVRPKLLPRCCMRRQWFPHTVQQQQVGPKRLSVWPHLLGLCWQSQFRTRPCAELEPYYILHFTYGDDYTLEGEFTPGKVGLPL